MLDVASRRRIYDAIRAHPGKYLRELQRDLGIAMGALEHHLDALVDAGLVSVSQSANKRYFPTEIDRRDKPVLAFLRQELPRRALLEILREGTIPRARLLERLSVAPSTFNHHARHLVEAGLVRRVGSEREAAFEAVDPERIVRLLVTYRASFLDRWVDRLLDGMEGMTPARWPREP